MQTHVATQERAQKPVQKQKQQPSKHVSREHGPSTLMLHRYLGSRNSQHLETEQPGDPGQPAGERLIHAEGKPLDASTRRFFEPLFSHNFANVRVHTGEQAAESAKTMHARAYTMGSEIVFGAGQYAPATKTGKRLIAHELAHVVQQERSPSVSNTVGVRKDVYEQAAEAVAMLATIFPEIKSSPARSLLSNYSGSFHSTPAIQKQDETAAPDLRVDDPNFLVCLILCYLGIPPAIWKTAIELFLRAVWEEYQATYDREQAEKNFYSFRLDFQLYSTFKAMQTVLTFAIQGKIGLIPIRAAAAKKLQERIIQHLLAKGASMAALGVVEQVARKVVIAVEVVFAAGCGIYCGSIAYAQTMVELTEYMALGIAATVDILETFGAVVGAALTSIIARPILVSRAMLDPMNWDLSPIPSHKRGDFGALGIYLWDQIEPENVKSFLTNSTRPLTSYQVPPDLIEDIARSMSETTLANTGFNIVFTPEIVIGCTPLSFVQLMRDYELIKFVRDPEQIADQALAAQPE